jgi:hypothetical protein
MVVMRVFPSSSPRVVCLAEGGIVYRLDSFPDCLRGTRAQVADECEDRPRGGGHEVSYGSLESSAVAGTRTRARVLDPKTTAAGVSGVVATRRVVDEKTNNDMRRNVRTGGLGLPR